MAAKTLPRRLWEGTSVFFHVFPTGREYGAASQRLRAGKQTCPMPGEEGLMVSRLQEYGRATVKQKDTSQSAECCAVALVQGQKLAKSVLRKRAQARASSARDE